MKTITIAIAFLASISVLNAQNDSAASPVQSAPKDGSNQFLLMGNASMNFFADKDNAQFGDVNFKPIFLWRISDRLFMESEVEIETGDGAPDIGLEYANMCYVLNPWMTFHAGRFLPKFGTYRGRFGEAFLNRFATDPAGFGDGGIGPMNEVGIGLQGGIQLGIAKMNYDFWLSNGPQLLTGSPDDPSSAGQFEYEAYIDNNNNKAIGGRIGLLPFPNSCMEIGYSFEHAAKTGDAGTPFENTPVMMQDVDLNYFHVIAPLKSFFRLTGEWKQLSAGNVTYFTQDSLSSPYTFSNSSSAFYATASLRPAFVHSRILSRFEIAGRYSSFMRPQNAPWGGSDVTRVSLALDYWVHWNSLVKFCYEKEDNVPDSYYIQFVLGF